MTELSINYGCYNYEWINAIYASGIELFNETGTTCDFNNHEVKSAIQFIEKLNALNRGFNITSNDFDQGKVAFCTNAVFSISNI